MPGEAAKDRSMRITTWITTILTSYLVTAGKIPWAREPNSERLAKSLKTVSRARGKYSEFACSEARRPENPVTKAIQTFRITREARLCAEGDREKG